MIKKYCSKCKEEKDINDFSVHRKTKDGFNIWCKECCKQYYKEYRKKNEYKLKQYYKEYLEKNKKELKLKNRKYYLENKEKIKEKVLIYQKTKNGKKVKKKSSLKYRNTDNAKQIRDEWINKNRKKLNRLKRIRYKKNKLNHNISQGIRDSLRYGKNGRHWENLVNFTLNDLKCHIEKQFKDGMSWNNYGRFGWHIDHIRPISSFNIIDYNCEDFKKCWCLDNLQPLWAEENLSKGSRFF